MSEQPPLLLCCFDVIPGPSGISRRVTEYLEGISEKYQVVVLSTKTPDHSHIERYRGARLLRVPVGTGDLPSRIQTFDRAVRRQLESEEYLLVHCFDPFAGYALCERRDELNYRVVYDAQTFPSQELRYSHPHLEGDRRFLSKVRRQELYCLMNSDAVITGSETTRAFILDQGVPGHQVRVIRPPVDRTPYTPEVMGRPDASPMKILHLGSQLSYQGLPTLLKALSIAMSSADVRLTVVGPKHSDWQAHLNDLVTELKLTGKVEFQAPVAHADVHKIVATCDVGALTLDDNERNRRQGGPLARLGEYLAGGRPVLAADLPVTRELLTDAEAAFYAPSDSRGLAEKIVALAQDPKRRVRMGAAARHLSEKYDAAFVRGQLLDLYADLAGRPRGDPGEEAAAEITRSAVRPTEDSSKTGRQKTDPAIRLGGVPETGETTDPEALRGDPAPPAILGTPVRDEARVVIGKPLPKVDDAARSSITDRNSSPDAPVMMGTPLGEKADPTPQELPSLDPPPPPAPRVRHTPPHGAPAARPPVRHTPAHGLKAADAKEPPPRHTPPHGLKPAEKGGPVRHTPAHGVKALGEVEKAPTSGRGLAAPKHTPPRGARPAEPQPLDKPPRATGAPSARTPPPRPPAAGSSARSAPATPPQPPPSMPEVTPVNRPPQPPPSAPDVTPIGRPTLDVPIPTAPSGLPALAMPEPPPPRKGTTGVRPVPKIDQPTPEPVPTAPEAAPSGPEFGGEEADLGPPPPLISRPRAPVADSLEAELPEAEGFTPAPAAARAAAPADDADEPAEVGDEEVMEISSGELESAEEAVPEASEHEALEVADDHTPLPTRLDPWFAQIAHGYCPSDSAAFSRHTPPTNFPGRDR